MIKKNVTAIRMPATADLRRVCLHCAFFDLHRAKYPEWREDKDHRAFNDLVNSAANIVAEVFCMLEPMGQVEFQRNVMRMYMAAERGGDDSPEAVEEVVEMFRSAIHQSKTKH